MQVITVFAIITGAVSSAFGAEVLSLQPTRISATPGALHVTLENRSRQAVLGFCMKSRTTPLILQEFAPPRSSGIAPGSFYDTTLPVDSALPGSSDVSSFAVTCVLFDDGTAEGDKSDLAMIENLRTGRELQTARLLPILDEVRRSSDDHLAEALQEAINRIASMDITLQDGSRAEGLTANGIRNTNTLFIQELRQIAKVRAASGGTSARARLEAAYSDQLRFHDKLTRTRLRMK